MESKSGYTEEANDNDMRVYVKHDPVQHPAHYTSGGVECIDAIEAAVSASQDGVDAFLTGQVIKYVWRHRLKGKPLEDLQKARWYLDRMIAREWKKELDAHAKVSTDPR